MEKVINCPCGFVLRGKNDEEVLRSDDFCQGQVMTFQPG